MSLDVALFLLGPISSSSPEGPGRVWSWFAIFIGCWVLIGSWRSYLKKPELKIPLFNLLWVSGIAVLFLVLGVRGVLR
jgi:hypothetical protein